MLRTQIYLPERQLRILKKKAAEEDISVSELIRVKLEESLVRSDVQNLKKRENIGKWLNRVAKKVSFKGAPKDLAKNMDRYLYDKDFR